MFTEPRFVTARALWFIVFLTASLEAFAQTGESLARIYCAACHVFPEPGLLTRKQWAHHVLPQMAVWMGVEPANYENIQDGGIIKQANLYPPAPMVSDSDWFKIWHYYVTNAPADFTAVPPPPSTNLTLFRPRKVSLHTGVPMTSLVKINAEEKLLYAADAFTGNLSIIDPSRNGLRTVRLGGAAVGLELIEAGLCVTLMRAQPSAPDAGSASGAAVGGGLTSPLAPTEQTFGKVLLLNRDDPELRANLLDNLRRPAHTQVADLNGDGLDDLIVCSFGNRLGSFSWFRRIPTDGAINYHEHVLLPRPGAIASAVRDIDADGDPDILVLMAQAQEGLYLFRNKQDPNAPSTAPAFELQPLIEEHPAFGFASFALADFNGDGLADVLTANGDNGDLPLPGKPYHGIRIYLASPATNSSTFSVAQAWFFPMQGAYKALPADFDGDGDIDIAAIAYYPDYVAGAPISFLYLDNTTPMLDPEKDGPNGRRPALRFEARSLPEASDGRWMVMDVNDLDGDGDTDIVLGSFIPGPTTIPVPPTTREQWRHRGSSLLILENRFR